MAEFFPGVMRTWSEAQILTRAAPTLATEGMTLDGCNGYRVIVEAEATRTLTSGTLQAWYYDETLAAWIRNPDLDLTITGASQRRQVWGDSTVSTPLGRVLYAASSVVVSGGTTVTVYIVASTAFLRR